jgi:beta-glucosidase
MALAQSLVSCGSDAVLSDGGAGSADRNSPFDAGRDQALGAESMDAGLDQPMGGIDSPSVDAGGTRVPTWADDRVRALIGQMTVAEKIAQLQNTAPSIDRLKLPAYQYWNEALHGVVTGGATSFPQAIALGSTWDPDLVHEVASAISDEARGFSARDGKGLTYWAPVINMLRDPRWGRFEESYSEDPWLMARMGVAFVRGMQGDDVKYLKTVATPKHYAGNNSEFNRHTGSSDIDEQLLHEYYLPAFEATVREAGAFSVMAAYNRVNGVPASANPLLLQTLLRDSWGFSGYVVSDCDAVADIVNGHHWVSTLAQASAKALLAGTDLNCGTTYPEQLQSALDQHLLSEADIDRALSRVLRARFLLGEFDAADSVPYRAIHGDVIESTAHAALARKAAQEAIVLLKNDGLLPLDRSTVRSIAVIGPHGGDVTLGGYSGAPDHTVSVLAGIDAKVGGDGGSSVTYEPGCSITEAKDQSAIDAAAALAAESDVAIVVVGTSQSVLREEMDRPDWSLPGAQSDLISAVLAANPRTVVVLVTAGPVAIDWAKAHVPAILTAFYDGQDQGTAIADALFGDINPGGKLTTTWYTGDATLPPIDDYDLRKGRTYLYYDQAPLYPFGHGLSYTSFAYANLTVGPGVIDKAGLTTVSVDVTNTGSRAGDEVVQLYVHDAAAGVPRPLKQLRGFRRVHLEPGQKETLTFAVAARDLAFWDVTTHGWRVADGLFELAVGSSSLDVRARSSLRVQSQGSVDSGRP